MLAVSYPAIKNDLKEHCDKVADNDETIMVTCKDEKNVVILSLEKYNLMMKAAKNAEYMAMLDRGFEQLTSGKGQQHELIEVEEHE